MHAVLFFSFPPVFLRPRDKWYLRGMISLLSSFSSKEFSSSVPDVEFSISSDRALVVLTVTKSGTSHTIYSEYLYPGSTSKVALTDIDRLVEASARKWITFSLSVSITEQSVSSSGTSSDIASRTLQTQVVSCSAVIRNASASDFCSSHFLSLFDGTRQTDVKWLQYLCFIGSGSASCAATYTDGSLVYFSVPSMGVYADYTMLDCSPVNFLKAGRTLMSYTITAGSRSQKYEVVDFGPDCAPALLFFNSFGVQEIAYCAGQHQMSASFNRQQARIGRYNVVYDAEEKETFHADTGILTMPMARWWRDVLRSRDIRVLPIYNDAVEAGEGIPVIITGEKSDISNAPDSLPRFTFDYEYADRNHNMLDVRREGRIFDNTFDYTFN